MVQEPSTERSSEYGTFQQRHQQLQNVVQHRYAKAVLAVLIGLVCVLGWSGSTPNLQVEETLLLSNAGTPQQPRPALVASDNTILPPPPMQTQYIRVCVDEVILTHNNQSSTLLHHTPKGLRVFWDEDTADIVNGKLATAVGTFNDSLLQTGWSKLSIHATETNANIYNDIRAASYATGYAEGALTSRRIDEHFINTYEAFFGQDDVAPKKLMDFFAENLEWLRSQVHQHTSNSEYPNNEIEFWKAIGLVLAQFDGMVAGYQAYTTTSPPRTSLQLYLLNADGDLEDLIPAVNKTRTRRPGGGLEFFPDESINDSLSYVELVKSLKCSALIRITPNASSLVWGHTTWDVYNAMNRIYKYYDFPVPNASRRVVSMSSSPGYLASVDDFYMMNNGISVMETTNGLYRDELYHLIKPESVLTWMRSIVANMLGNTGDAWTKTFSMFNSGTYNNQWMIIDTSKFVKGVGFTKNGLTILEQRPGLVETRDASSDINTAGYWASYNVPSIPQMYRDTGFEAKYVASNYSSAWSHDTCPRALIFKRDAPLITNLDGLKNIMRYNDWQHDPLSLGHPSNAIAARYDLESGSTFKLDGGIDSKVTSLELAKKLQCEAISGPSSVNNPVFTWSNASLPPTSHLGQPTVFNFSYEKMEYIKFPQ